MSTLYEKSQIKLELNQVLEQLSQCAGSPDGKAACLSLQPTSDLEDVQAMQAETAAAFTMCTKKGNPAFGDIVDVSPSLDLSLIHI